MKSLEILHLLRIFIHWVLRFYHIFPLFQKKSVWDVILFKEEEQTNWVIKPAMCKGPDPKPAKIKVYLSIDFPLAEVLPDIHSTGSKIAE